MRVAVDTTAFARQRRVHQLRFCCEHCAFFMPQGQLCAHGWPTTDHRLARYERHEGAQQREPVEVVFCKEFELF